MMKTLKKITEVKTSASRLGTEIDPEVIFASVTR